MCSFVSGKYGVTIRMGRSAVAVVTFMYATQAVFFCGRPYFGSRCIKVRRNTMQGAVYLIYSMSKECNLKIATKKTKVFGFVGVDHLRTIIIINNETLEQVSELTYLGCSISYHCSSDIESKLANFFTINRYY